MLRKTALLLSMVTSLSLASFAQSKPPEVTLDDILAKNLKAHGGAEKFNTVKSVRMTTTLEYAPGADADFKIEIERPDKVHYGFTLQGMTQSQGYDGKVGWGNDPFSGKRDAEPLAKTI